MSDISSCEMCGAQSILFRAVIEGTELNVCKKCARYGKVVYRPRPARRGSPKPVRKNPDEALFVVENFSKLLKQAREKMDLKQEEAAKQLSEKESLIHNLESGQYKPSIPLARKLERFYNVKLIEEYEDIGFEQSKKTGVMTIGDRIKIKKR